MDNLRDLCIEDSLEWGSATVQFHANWISKWKKEKKNEVSVESSEQQNGNCRVSLTPVWMKENHDLYHIQCADNTISSFDAISFFPTSDLSFILFFFAFFSVLLSFLFTKLGTTYSFCTLYQVSIYKVYLTHIFY